MARSPGRTRWVFAALAVIGVVGLTTWLAWRDGDRSRAARVASEAVANEPLAVDTPATVGTPGGDPRTPVSTPAGATDPLTASPRDDAQRKDSPPEPIDFWLRVVDAASDAPIASASVTVTSTSWGLDPFHPTQKAITSMSDVDGALALPSKAGWQVPVSVHVDGYLDTRSSVDDTHGARANALSLTLFPTVSLEVRLIGPSVGAGTHEIGVSSPEADLDVRALRVDGRGVAQFESIPAGATLWIGVREPNGAGRWLSQDVRLRAREPAVLEYDISGGSVIRGVVLDAAGDPTPDCQVVLTRMVPGDSAELHYIGDDDLPSAASGARTDATGRFELPGIAAGSYWLGTASREGGCADIAERITVPRSGDLEVTLSCRPGLSITGRTLSPSGTPEASDVELRGVDIDVSMRSFGFDNTFSFDSLVAGRYRVRAAGHRRFARSDWIEVEAGARDVVLQLTEGATIRGTLPDVVGAAIGDASVEAFADDGTTSFRSDVRLPDFELTGVPRGTCVVIATTSDGRIATSRPIDIEHGATVEGVRLLVEQAATIDLALPDYAVYAVVVALDGVPIAFEDEALGRAAFVVPVRELEVRAEYRGRVVARRTVAPRAGELLEVDLRVE